jgi:glycosyltransferase involved in cell wall biosynthesis
MRTSAVESGPSAPRAAAEHGTVLRETAGRDAVGEEVRSEAGVPRSRPTVLVVGPLPPPYHGGAVATSYVLGSELAERFRLVHVDTRDTRGQQNMGRLDLRNVVLAFRHARMFLTSLLREAPALVYVPIAQNRLGYLRDCLFLVPALLAGRRVVVHVHAGGFRDFYDGADPLTRALVRGTLARVQRAIVLGERLRASVAGLVPDARVTVVPNGVADPFGGRPRASFDAGAREAGTVTVLYLGTLMEAKGFLDLLAAARRLRAERPGLRYIFAGSFYRASDRARALELLADGLRDVVELTGVVDGERKAALLRQADLLVLPTRYANEAHPYVVLEAMAAGLPVVTTARGAIAETVRDGETGVIVPEGDVSAIAEAIARLAVDAPLRRRMSDAARRRYVEEYRLERWSDRMAAAFEAALAR